MTPCAVMLGCAKPQGNANAENALGRQVTATEKTYSDIYARAERNGGLFASTDKPSVASQSLADVSHEAENAIPDTSALISEIYLTVKDITSYAPGFNAGTLTTYVIDIFTYTQIAQAITAEEKNLSLTQTYSVDYEVNEELLSKLSYGLWTTKIPEEMSFAGFDEQTNKVNILFKARSPKDKQSNVNRFEKVNSEMYYLSDNDFGYAQFTYRYDTDGTHLETGFDFFSMKDKAMLCINADASGRIVNMAYNGLYTPVYGANSERLKPLFDNLEDAFNQRTQFLEQQNLALASEAGIADIKTEVKNGNTVYIKEKSEKSFEASFDYSVLAKMK